MTDLLVGIDVGTTRVKAVATDHGPPLLPADVPGEVWFLSDEHATVRLGPDDAPPRVGDLVRLRPSHVDPTVSRHQWLWPARGDSTEEDPWPVAIGWGSLSRTARTWTSYPPSDPGAALPTE